MDPNETTSTELPERPPTAPTDGNGPGRPAPTVFARSARDRLVAGVCGGLGQRLGVDPVVLRLALLPLVLAAGAGIAAYLVLWAVAREPDPTTDEGPTRPASNQQLIAIALIVLGTLVLLRSVGLWFGDGIVWPVALASLGSAFAWGRDGADPVFGLRRSRAGQAGGGASSVGAPVAGAAASGLDASLGAALREAGPLRVVGGAVLVLGGMVGFLAANTRLSALWDVALAAFVGLVGIGLLLGPWLVRLATQLGSERRERIRGEERAAVAAHLHDSVLQTLALIQRTADQPARTVALARRQERELRAWLYGGAGHGEGDEPTTIGEALGRLATEVEDDQAVRVEAVVVGDRPLAGNAPELLAAVREATSNAARHAGADVVDVYVEADLDEGRLWATVRDRGVGFDPAEVADDRHGIRHSIRGRLTRAGGGATLHTSPGAGAEWELWVPLERNGPDDA